jgi:hypothetical protein
MTHAWSLSPSITASVTALVSLFARSAPTGDAFKSVEKAKGTFLEVSEQTDSQKYFYCSSTVTTGLSPEQGWPKRQRRFLL